MSYELLMVLLKVKLTGKIVDVSICRVVVVGGFREDMLNGGIGFVHGDSVAAPSIESRK